MDEYARVRRAHFVDGLSIKALAREFHHSRRKVREMLATPELKRYVRLNPPPSILNPFKPLIDAILEADEEAPRKQRHNAKKIWRRLQQEHGYGGGYERVRLYLRQRQQWQRETFIPLDHDPGQRLEADFGHIYVDFPDGRRQVPVLGDSKGAGSRSRGSACRCGATVCAPVVGRVAGPGRIPGRPVGQGRPPRDLKWRRGPTRM